MKIVFLGMALGLCCVLPTNRARADDPSIDTPHFHLHCSNFQHLADGDWKIVKATDDRGNTMTDVGEFGPMRNLFVDDGVNVGLMLGQKCAGK